MRKRHLRNRGLVLATVVIAAVAALATVPQTAASAAAAACPGGGPLVVNAYGTYRNSADYGADGHVWALDAARESIQIWQVGTNTYCLKRQDIGTFTTFAGVSPEGTGTVSSGVTGRWYGEVVALIHGTFARHARLRRGLRREVSAGRHMPWACVQCEALLLQHRLRPSPHVQRDVRKWSLRCVAAVNRRRHRRHRLLDDD